AYRRRLSSRFDAPARCRPGRAPRTRTKFSGVRPGSKSVRNAAILAAGPPATRRLTGWKPAHRPAGSRRYSREPRKLLVIRLALFHVGVPPLLPLFRHVIKESGVAGEVEQADLPVAVGVHRRPHA